MHRVRRYERAELYDYMYRPGWGGRGAREFGDAVEDGAEVRAHVLFSAEAQEMRAHGGNWTCSAYESEDWIGLWRDAMSGGLELTAPHPRDSVRIRLVIGTVRWPIEPLAIC